MNQKRVLVTGAGSGIGKEFTRLFLRDGSRVLAVSLLQDELDRLQSEFDQTGGRLQTLQMDLSASDAAERLLTGCEQNGWIPDILINNAGFVCFGEALNLPLDRVESMIALNVLTLTKTSILFGRKMRERGHGRILNVGSTAGMVPSQRMAAYCASKSYVNTFSFALAAELAASGVTVTCLTPGATATNFAKAGQIDQFAGRSMLKDMFAQGKVGSAAAVAAAGYHGLLQGRRHVLVGKGSSLAAWMSRLFSPSVLPGLIKDV